MNKEQTALERIATALEYISEDLKALRDLAEETNQKTNEKSN